MRTCGRIATYQDGCRCDDCRLVAADTRTAARRRARTTLTPTGPPVDWAAAACAGLDPELFHPARNENVEPAKAVCADCPIQSDCLAWALRTDQPFGIWGGRSTRERHHIANR